MVSFALYCMLFGVLIFFPETGENGYISLLLNVVTKRLREGEAAIQILKYMLLTGWEVRIAGNCGLGLEYPRP